ncbi:MAG: HD domain-containing protein [Planctomycetota bacterium]|nr:HD domain-containing protein [Planctomycetota bacterium]
MKSLTELFSLIAADPQLRKLKEGVSSLLSSDPGHNLDHALRVGLWTIRLGQDQFPREWAVAAALCHDLVNVPKESEDRSKASTLSARATRELLPRFGFTGEALDEICRAVVQHSYSSGAVPTAPLAIALQDADRLEALGAIGILRTISTGVFMKNEYFHIEDPWAKHRALNDKAFMIDHFYEKLLALPDTLLTEAGRSEAKLRVKIMTEFLEALGRELGIPCPN